ncbi:trimethylamine---corrinoid protein Co-methyltransferase [Shimia gijangensis]|uniref:Methyltransferase n=1 Tax=Shimia gijangensis TaxID=1470563 RepID=A0A1M6N249_9RHOB|nr:trimethylamine methyltransferase family protein [Shimia gijangensis]SHJ89762.1 trimethylamine---corrinoid protein Co-methyltransferase [Shimia gijangensis]
MARRGRNVVKGSGKLAQSPWGQPINRFGPITFAAAEEIEALHDASMELLENTGLYVLSEKALRLYEAAGAKVDYSNNRVRLGRDMVKACLASAPSQFTLHARNPDRNLEIGGKNLTFLTAATPPYCSDIDRGRRTGNFQDMSDLLRLCQSLNTVHAMTGYPVEPQDLPVPTRHLDCYAAFIELTDKVWRPYGTTPDAVKDGLEMICIARGISREQLKNEPSLLINVNINSPLTFDDTMSDSLIEMSEMGQAVIVSPFTLAGATSPVTMEGALAQQNAEVLSGIVLTQIVRPGAPVVYGAFSSNVDMKTGSPAFGTPEYNKCAIISGQLARRYGLPYRSSNINSSNVVDAQATYESQMSIWGAFLGGVNVFFHGHGWLESGLTTSFEKLVIDSEMLQMMTAAMKPLSFSAENLAVEVVDEVGPGGHFFGTAHTLARYRNAFHAPMVSDWNNFENWNESGGLDATQRANAVWKQLLQEYTPPPLEEDRREAIHAYVAKRKAEIETMKAA